MSVVHQPNRKVVTQGHEIEVPPRPAERGAHTGDTGIPSEPAADVPRQRRCFMHFLL